jgi:hypothetical protein
VDPDQVDLDKDATEEKKVLIEMIKEMPPANVVTSLDIIPRPTECLPPTLHTLAGLRGLRLFHQQLDQQQHNQVKGNPDADQLLLNRLFKTFFWSQTMIKQIPNP